MPPKWCFGWFFLRETNEVYVWIFFLNRFSSAEFDGAKWPKVPQRIPRANRQTETFFLVLTVMVSRCWRTYYWNPAMNVDIYSCFFLGGPGGWLWKFCMSLLGWGLLAVSSWLWSTRKCTWLQVERDFPSWMEVDLDGTKGPLEWYVFFYKKKGGQRVSESSQNHIGSLPW